MYMLEYWRTLHGRGVIRPCVPLGSYMCACCG